MSKKKLNKQLENLFKKLNIKKGDKIIIHSNIAGILQYYKGDTAIISEIFFSFLKKYIGNKGAIVIPTYSYQFTYKKKINIKKSPSEVGVFSNYLLKKNWIKRTLDPIFSHLVFGKIEGFNLKFINTNAFGNNSIFHRLLENNFKIICFCCSSDRITFIHYIESVLKVKYRFIKNFKGFLEIGKNKTKISYKYNVGKKKIDYSLKEEKINKLLKKGNFMRVNFGKFECYSSSCSYLFSRISKKIKKNDKFLII